MAEKEIKPYTNIPYLPQDGAQGLSIDGAQFLGNVKQLQVGFGAQVLRVDRDGLWLGAERFVDAPFSVDMLGNIRADSLTLGTIVGDLDDIADGSTYYKTTLNEVAGAGQAYQGLNASGEIIKGFLNTQLGARTLPANGVRVDSSGIYGRKSSVTTFYIDTNGNAYFSGDIVSATMTSSVITGGTIQTALTGERVKISSGVTSDVEFYYDDTRYGHIGANRISASESYIEFVTDDGNGLFLDTGIGVSGYNSSELTSNGGSLYTNGNASNGTTGMLGKDGVSSIEIVTTGAATDIDINVDDGDGYLNITALQVDITGGLDVSDTSRYRTIAQPILYHGYVSGTTISDANNSFTASNPSTGIYNITHSFGNTSYQVQVTPFASTVKNITISSLGTNAFTVRIANLADALENNDFMFLLVKKP